MNKTLKEHWNVPHINSLKKEEEEEEEDYGLVPIVPSYLDEDYGL